MLAYYSKWISKFSDKIIPLKEVNLPFNEDIVKHIKNMIKELTLITRHNIDFSQEFTIETDASYGAIAATLSQNGQPVAFFSRTLSKCKKIIVQLRKKDMQ